MAVVVKLSRVFVHKNKKVRALRAVGITISGAASNKSVQQTEFVGVCFLLFQRAAANLKRYVLREKNWVYF